MEIFLSEHVQSLLHNKFVVIIGDSVQRAVYKDIVTILQSNAYTTEKELKTKGERSHQGDTLIEGGELAEMNNRKSYREVRQWQHPYHLVRFYFVTRCYSEYMETVLLDLSKKPQPDVVIMNSCLWDITRYGPSSMDMYKKNLQTLFSRFDEILPRDTLVVWHTTMPIAEKIRGGFLIEQIEFMNDVLRLDVMVANFYAAQVVQDHNYDVLDLHHIFRSMLKHRKRDGVHWDFQAHRRITNVLLSHVCRAWGIELPKFTAMHKQKQKEDRMRQQNVDLNNNSQNSAYRSEEERYGGPIRRTNYNHGHHQRSVSAPGIQVVGIPGNFVCEPNPQINLQQEQQLYIQQQNEIFQQQQLMRCATAIQTFVNEYTAFAGHQDQQQAGNLGNWGQAPQRQVYFGGHNRHHPYR